jgi:hypothetical protein
MAARALAAVLLRPALAQEAEPAPATAPTPAASASVPAAAAQADPTLSLEQRIDKALADYDAIDKDPKAMVMRQRALLWLGDLDHDRVTEKLQAELQAAADKPFATSVLQAIARTPRPALQEPVWQVLQRSSAPAAARIAAAQATAALGERGVARLVQLVKGDAPAEAQARNFALTALVQSNQPRAVEAVAGLLQSGTTAQRQDLLRRLENVRNVAAISAARMRLAKEAELVVAAPAWRQLAVEGHPRAKDLLVDVFERMPGDPAPTVMADLLVGLCLVRDAEFYPVLLRYAANPADPVRRVLRTAAGHAAKDPALLQFLIAKGLEDPKPGAREAAIALLAEAPAEAVQPLVAKVRKNLADPKRRSLDLVVGLNELLARDPSWANDCLQFAASRDQDTRILGLSLLHDLGSDLGVVHAQQSVGAKEWPLRSMAYRYLAKFRDVASIPLLIARWEREDGRLQAELSDALFAHTATRCWQRREWEAWWEKHKVGFALPHIETVRAAKPAAGGAGGGSTVSYHDLPLVSTKAAFLVDHSGSMSAALGTDKKYNRLEAAKDQLRKVVQGLPKTHQINLVAYDDKIDALWDRLRPLNEENRADLLQKVDRMRLGGGTNIFDALERAFQDPTIDTIYLLTDGEPSAGRLVAPDAIADEVRRWNRTRQVVIHCIGLGIDSRLLKRLAAESGGEYRHVR